MKKRDCTKLIILLLYAGSLLRCSMDSKRAPAASKTTANEASGKLNDTTTQINRWIDYINYQVSSYAIIKADSNCQQILHESTKDKHDFPTISNALEKIKDCLDSKKKSVNQVLSEKIDSLKRDTSVKINNEYLASYLTDSIFKDSIHYKALYIFHQSRSNNPYPKKKDTADVVKWQKDSISFQYWKTNLQKAIQDSIKKFNMLSDANNTPKTSNYKVNIILAAIALAGCFLLWRSNKKRNRLSTSIGKPISKDIPEKNVTTNDRLLIESKGEIETLKNEIKSLQNEIESLQNRNETLSAKLNSTLAKSSNLPIAATAVPATQKNVAVLYYPAPQNNTFSIEDGSSSKRSLDSYQLAVTGNYAYFSLIIDDKDVVKRALASPDLYILPICNVEGESGLFGNAQHIQIIEKGKLQQEGDRWVLQSKSIIKLI